jgi:hypothetical protein
VDGNRADLHRAEDLLIGVDLPPGKHAVEFRFAPVPVYLGLAVTLGAFLGVMILAYADPSRIIGICNGSER